MTKEPIGGFAFPVPEDSSVNSQEGMTLRDYFAGQALAGLMAQGGCMTMEMKDSTASVCYEKADAMLKAREE